MHEVIGKGVLFIGDNLATLTGSDARGRRFVPPGSVDLVYLDPPFNSGRDYSTDRKIGNVPVGTRAFGDRFRWSADADAAYRALIDAAPRRLAAALEIVECAYAQSPMLAYIAFMAPRLVALHDALAPTGYLWLHCDDSASHALAIVLDGIFGARPGNRKVMWVRSDPKGGVTRHFGRTLDTLLVYPKRRNVIVRNRGAVWDDIRFLSGQSKERTGYPTQKPLALLKRIVGMCSKPGGIVLDPFVGSGTAVVAAQEMGRYWIGLDVSPLAGEVVRSRLAKPVPHIERPQQLALTGG